MASFNQVILIGNLTRDPELRFIPAGTAVCDLSIAVNEKYKAKNGEMREEVSFFDCTCWGRTAEVAAEYLKKGRSCMIVGKLKQDRWDDEKTGQKRSKVKVTVTTIQFLGAKGERTGPPQGEEGGQGDPLVDEAATGGAPVDSDSPF